VTDWSVNTGTVPVGRIEIGDTLRRTFTVSFDDVVVTSTDTGPPPARPNVLIFLTDDQRATDTMTPAVMPKLRGWLLGTGSQFTNFFGTTPLCCPDRSVLLSGRYAHNTGVRMNTDTAIFDHSLTMERLLQQAGYRTAYVGKFLNGWPNASPPPFFTDRALVAGGYANKWFNVDGAARQVPYTTDFVGQQTVTYLDRFETDDAQPWMLIAAPTAPHNPWEPSAAHANDNVGTWAGNPATQESDRSDKPPWVRARNYSLAQAENVRVPQLRTLRSVDDMVDTVLTRLQQLGELSNTLVIYTSDNGYLWSDHHLGGDYGTAAQKRYPYEASVKLPFLMRWDGHVAAGATDQRLAGMVDIAATVLDAAGVVPSYHLDGYSLLTDHARTRIVLEYWLDPGDASIPTWVSVRTQDVMYVEYYDATGGVTFREYYALANDPWELVNLLNDGVPSDPDTTQLHSQVVAGATCQGTTLSDPPVSDPCP
jgi:arylsulfatase A-like enzyme